MKHLKALSLVLTITACGGAYARDSQQIASQQEESAVATSQSPQRKAGWVNIRWGYSHTFLSEPMPNVVRKTDSNDLTIAVLGGFNLPKTHFAEEMLGTSGSSLYRFYLETGVKMKFFIAWGSRYYAPTYSGDISKDKFNWYYVAVPLNLVYDIPIKEELTLRPYVGVYARFNLFHNDLWQRNLLQGGVQAGLAIDVNSCHLGVQYAHDFTPIVDNVLTHSVEATFGVYF